MHIHFSIHLPPPSPCCFFLFPSPSQNPLFKATTSSYMGKKRSHHLFFLSRRPPPPFPPFLSPFSLFSLPFLYSNAALCLSPLSPSSFRTQGWIPPERGVRSADADNIVKVQSRPPSLSPATTLSHLPASIGGKTALAFSPISFRSWQIPPSFFMVLGRHWPITNNFFLRVPSSMLDGSGCKLANPLPLFRARLAFANIPPPLT